MSTSHDELSRAQVARAGMPGPGEEPHFLPHPLMDRLLEAVIVLGGELWIERDRRRALESLLESKGMLRMKLRPMPTEILSSVARN